MHRLMKMLSATLIALMVTCLVAMVLMVFGNVVMRYGFNSGITLSEELSRWLFVWMTFLGAVVALMERGHLGTDTVIARLPRGAQRVCWGLTHALMLMVCLWVLKGSWVQTQINWGNTSAVMEVPVGCLYASGMVFALLSAPLLLWQLWRLISGQVGDHELVGLQGSEDSAAPHQPA
jgi:TRAP-type C4-dicarboxylate transport system permease small subunit